MLFTSPTKNKIIVIYNKHFFSSIYKEMTLKYPYAEFFKDVCKILLTPEKKAK